ncbi:MAG: Pyrimidine-nucleoside phosphorylase [Synergistetes bacterium ADurb.BinA166]|nr:MAG: Pyrimidine-nucleoside phosphorylase [Synergistetes bacterium ADurb.BinA166]
MFDMISFIERKRDGGVHSAEDLRLFVQGFASGAIPDYQAGAWLMAVYYSGLNEQELTEFTLALARSGEVLSFGDLRIVDKHSTGGVGDKVTLLLVPLAASCGAKVAKLSGPGLGFTGGTVDKLEAIPGFRTHLPSNLFADQVRRIGCAISGHSADLAPAEGKFYGLRDVTGTVPSLPLICSSIISKKIAGGADSFVFDVKCGGGAFMPDYPSAERLASSLVSLSKSLGKRSMALVTAMEEPLGEWIGNSVEVLEAVSVLRGEGPGDVREVVVNLAGAMVSIDSDMSFEEGMELADSRLSDGSALEKFAEMVHEQGGDPAICSTPGDLLPMANGRRTVAASSDGVVSAVDARGIGEGVKRLGGGRMALGDSIDLTVGARLLKKTGSRVSSGDPLIEILYNDEDKLSASLPFFESAFIVSGPASPQAAGPGKLILGRVS